MTKELDGRQRIRIADILHSHYSKHGSYGKELIQPLPSIVREVFGEELLTQYPVFPKKKIRDFISIVLEGHEDILRLLARLSEDDGKGESKDLQEQLNEVLSEIGLKLDSGKITTLAEEEIKILDDEISFLSMLHSLGFDDIREKLEKGLKGLRAQDPDVASSFCSLAFDALLKRKISAAGGNENAGSLGRLVNEAANHGVIESDVVQIFQGFTSLRNKVPQHSGTGGSVLSISHRSALLLAHMARVLMMYLLS